MYKNKKIVGKWARKSKGTLFAVSGHTHTHTFLNTNTKTPFSSSISVSILHEDQSNGLSSYSYPSPSVFLHTRTYHATILSFLLLQPHSFILLFPSSQGTLLSPSPLHQGLFPIITFLLYFYLLQLLCLLPV